ncbi:RNA polymerase sigma factor [Actinocorallia longicatena]|uniref:RNA polymerase sigma-70 region 2 domain-containing protein n=1 Tax=Actinocorallia longicatena TaxID=111803 RepID=A0ABP6QUI5_9ACTN
MPRWTGLGPEGDRELVVRLVDGVGLDELYESYVEQVFDYAVALAGEAKAAEDIVHDVMIDASRRAVRLRDRERLRGWLYAAVRRRAFVRARVRGVWWDWEGQPPGSETGLAAEEVRQLLEGALDRLSFADQDLLLLTLRHGITGADLAAVLGIAPFKAAARAAKVKSRAEAALAAQRKVHEARCAGTEDALDMLFQAESEQHDCEECRQRAQVPLELLMSVPPVVHAPTTLQHRVFHTGTDPELAGYRADISGKGGHLTPEGLPRQLDVASPLGRRWMFAGSGMAGALAAALIASFMIGDVLPDPGLIFPHEPKKTPFTSRSPQPRDESLVAAPGKGGRPTERPNVRPGPATNGTDLEEPPTPQGSPTNPAPGPSATDTPKIATEPPPTQAPPVAELKLGGSEIQVGGSRKSEIQMTAENGPVSWRAVSDTPQVTLDEDGGTLDPGVAHVLVVRLKPALLRLAGNAVITIIDTGTGDAQHVTVSWSLSLL